MASPQIPIAFHRRGNDSFEQFVCGENTVALAAVRSLLDTGASNRMLYLKGAAGSGKTLLLKALCGRARELDQVALYLPVAHLLGQGRGLPETTEGVDILCVDELDALAGLGDWEERLFHLLNQARAGGQRVLLAARQGPQRLAIELPDLRSRLSWGEVHRLRLLNEADRRRVVQARAAGQGVVLPEEVLAYLLKHGRRDIRSLLRTVEALQNQAFAAKRALSIPLLKEVLRAQKKAPPD